MSDLGLYSVLENKISQILPDIHIFGQSFPETAPPHIKLQLNPVERGILPQKAARIKTTIHITSRYKGESEIQDLHQKVLNVLEGETLILKENAAGLVRFEESQIRTDKDGVTRTAILIFTVLIKLK